ncbi:Protein timeless [Chlorella vulgaris]
MADLDLELLASIASGGLGSWQTDSQGHSVYVKSDDCIGCLHDLQRFFRYDDPEERPSFFAVSKYNFARSDLVPLIITYPDDYDVVYNALKVATFLTMPSSNLLAVREAFLAQDALAAVVGMLAEPLSRHPKMDERDAALVQLAITFFKNLAAMPEAPGSAAAGGGAGQAANKAASRRIQSGLLERLFADNVMDLLLLLAQHSQQRPFRSEAPVLVEIFMHTFCSVDPQQLLDAPQLLEAEQRRQREEDRAAARAAAEKKRRQQQQLQQQRGGGDALPPYSSSSRQPAAGLAHLTRLPALPLQRPFVPKALMPRHVAQAAPSRHAHSGAVYVRRHTEHSSNIVLRHNPHRSELPQLPAVVDAKKAPAQRKDGQAAGAGGKAAGAGAASSKLGAELLVRLDGFLQQFLDGAYDLLMTQVFKELEPGLNISRLSDADFLNFVRLSTYCTRYVRLKEERKLQAKLQQAKEGKQTAAAGEAVTGAAASGGAAPAGASDAAASPAAAEAAEPAAEASGDKNGEEGKGEQAEAEKVEEEEASPFAAISATMGWDCFHWLTMLWILLSNMEGGGRQKDHSDKNWELQHASVPLLKEMLLALDLARVAGNAADRRAADRLQRRLLHDDLKESGLLPVLSRLIKGYNFRFQPRSHAVDLVETLHVVLGMLDRLTAAESGGFRVKAAARKGGGGGRRRKPATPAAEQPEDGEEGDAAEAAGEAQQQQQQQQQEPASAAKEAGSEQQGSPGGGDANQSGDDAAAERVGRGGDPLDDDAYDEPRRQVTMEVSFEAARRVRQECAQPVIVHFYSWLLQGYRSNAAFTNHAILSFFRRIAEPQQLNLEPMLYQLSVLRLFESMLSDLSIKLNPDFAELLAFAKGTVRSLFARMVPDLSELRQKAGLVDANLDARFATANAAAAAAAAAAASGDEREADSTEQAARQERRLAQAELKARENAAAGMFLELLFWKGANVSEDVRNEYNWRGLVDPQEHKRRGGRRGRGSALGDDEGSGGEERGPAFFATYRKHRQEFSEEQAATLLSEFERRNGRKDCLDALVFEFGGQWKKSQVSKQLKAMGLARGKFTEGQEERMREKYEEASSLFSLLQCKPASMLCIATLLTPALLLLSIAQVKRHLRKVGVVTGKLPRGSTVPPEQERRMREMYDEGMARKDCFERIAEELGGSWTARKVKRHLQTMGVVPRLSKTFKQRQRDAAFDALADSSDQGGEGGGKHGASGSGSGSGLGSGSGSDSGGDSGFDSAKSELEEAAAGGSGGESDAGGSSDNDGTAGLAAAAAGGIKGKAARRTAALEKLQKSRGLRKHRPNRIASPELAGAGQDSEGDEEDLLGDAIAAQQAAAAEAASSPASSAGGSFVSLLDSDAEADAAAAATDAEAPVAKAPQRGPAAAAACDASGSSESDGGSAGGSDAGFESAQESDPGAAPAPVARQQKRQAAAPRQAHKQQQSKKRRGADGAAALASQQTKRKAEAAPAGPSSAQKRAALAALKRHRQQGGAASAAVAAVAPPTELLVDWQGDEQDGEAVRMPEAGAENVEPSDQLQQRSQMQQQVAGKVGGRRRIQKAGDDGTTAGTVRAVAQAVASLEDLEDAV